MNSNPETAKTTSIEPLPDLERLVSAIGHTRRWKMLKELTAGEPRTIEEMAKVGGCSYDNASKHLAMLRRAGLVVRAADGSTSWPGNTCPSRASRWWISAIACSGWTCSVIKRAWIQSGFQPRSGERK